MALTLIELVRYAEFTASSVGDAKNEKPCWSFHLKLLLSR